MVQALVMSTTLIIQFYCNGHIAYCKWQHYKQDKRLEVYIQTQQEDAENQLEHAEHQNNSRLNLPLNTNAHNKILAEVKHLTCLLIFITITVASKRSKSKFDNDQSSLIEASAALLYLYDFGTSILMFLIFPLLFYISHPELRKFVREIFICE